MICGCDNQEKQKDGRYQLVSGTYQAFSIDNRGNGGAGTGSEAFHGIFRIDTRTGKTWVFVAVVSSSDNRTNVVKEWREIKEGSISN
jgi:hypothetical protein